LDGRSGSVLITSFQTIRESLETHRQACSVRRHAIPDVRNSFATSLTDPLNSQVGSRAPG